MLNNAELVFLGLLRSAINRVPYNGPELLSESEWDLLDWLAGHHHMDGLVYEQIGRARLWKSAPKKVRSEMQRRTFYSIALQINRKCDFLIYYSELLSQGLSPIMLKGSICRNFYPTDYLRPSSDEDFLVTGNNYEKVVRFFRKKGFQPLDDLNDPEEAVLLREEPAGKRTLYEIHKSFFPKDSAFAWANDVLSEAVYNPIVEEIDGVSVSSVEPTSHIFFVIVHLLSHFVAGGVGIRQLCDIILMLRGYRDRINRGRLKKWLSDFHLEMFWMNLMEIAVLHLGLSRDELQGLAFENVSADSGEMLKDILDTGLMATTSMERQHSAGMTIKAYKDGQSRIGILRKILFPSPAHIRNSFSYTRRCGWLLPVGYVHRILKYMVSVVKKRHSDPKTGSEQLTAWKLGQKRIGMLRKYGLIRDE